MTYPTRWVCTFTLMLAGSVAIYASPIFSAPGDSSYLTTYKKGEMRALRIHQSPLSLPAIEFKDKSQRSVTPKDFRGKVVVLNLWATWCLPCVKELPALDALQSRFSYEDVAILAVSQDRAGNKVVPPFYERLRLRKLNIYLDNESTLMAAFRVSGLPTTILIDRSGKEVARLVGAINWDSPEVISLVKAISARP